ncbi:MAG: hypothetical protein FWD22_06300 [Treponema sp.]|nr:hypothetical protein [Treponema sp.]
MKNIKFLIIIYFTVVICFLFSACRNCDHLWKLTYIDCKQSKICTVCGATDNSREHNFIDNWIQTAVPACTTFGIDTRTCTRTGCYKIETRVGANALGHTFDTNWIQSTAPTCTTNGIETVNCTVLGCNGTNTRTGEAAHGHTFDTNWIQTTAPTCTTNGIETVNCTVLGCNGTNTRTGEAAIGHLYYDWIEIRQGVGTGIGTCQRNNCEVIDGLILTLEIGDTGPGGGIIFYTNPNGFSVTSTTTAFTTYIAYYLEAAPTDMPTTLSWSLQNIYNIIIPSISSIIGTGRNNTELILVIDSDAPAALECKKFNNNGLYDWFLPNLNELRELYRQRMLFGISSGYYWSSHFSPISWEDLRFSTAWVQDFENSNWYSVSDVSKDYFVRSIRAF